MGFSSFGSVEKVKRGKCLSFFVFFSSHKGEGISGMKNHISRKCMKDPIFFGVAWLT